MYKGFVFLGYAYSAVVYHRTLSLQVATSSTKVRSSQQGTYISKPSFPVAATQCLNAGSIQFVGVVLVEKALAVDKGFGERCTVAPQECCGSGQRSIGNI